MVMMNTRKISIIFISVILLLGAGNATIQAGSNDDAKLLYGKIYSKALKDLLGGNSLEKIDAAIKFGGHRVTRYIRPLGEELNKDLDRQEFRKTPNRDPYVKSQIAWALGRIGHRWSLPYLLDALEKTVAVVDSVKKERDELREKYRQMGVQTVVPEITRTGPAFMGPSADAEEIYPASPDVYWSQADEFKGIMAPNLREEDHRIRMMGYNYLNLAQYILQAIGDVASNNALYYKGLSITEQDKKQHDRMIEVLSKYIVHEKDEIRKYSAYALGGLGTNEAVTKLEEQYGKEEKAIVKVKLAQAILLNDRSKTDLYEFIVGSLIVQDIHVRRASAMALRELRLGESVFALKNALEVEHDETTRVILKQAIQNAEMDNIMPINY